MNHTANKSLLENVEISHLSNGVTLILKKKDTLPLVSIQIWVRAGSLYENDSSNGISHFLEHLVFKGTKNYDVLQISKIIESYGAILNAGTSKEYTMYFTDIPKEGLVDALKVLKELVFDATFPEEELERERDVVVEEIKRSEDNPGNVLFENFNRLLFVKSNYKYRIIGSEKNIRSFSREDIINYYKMYYRPKNIVVSICGDIDCEEVKKLVKDLFEGQKNEDRVSPLVVVDEDGKSDVVEVKKHAVQKTYFLFGFLGPKINDEFQYAGELFSVIFGEGRSSRLYKNLREREKLVYEIGSGFYTQVGPSIFYVSGVCEPKNLETVIKRVKEELKKVCEEGVSEEELKKARQIINTRWYFDNETVHSLASNFAWWYMFKNLNELDIFLQKINKVSCEDVQQFVKKYGGYLVVSALEP